MGELCVIPFLFFRSEVLSTVLNHTYTPDREWILAYAHTLIQTLRTSVWYKSKSIFQASFLAPWWFYYYSRRASCLSFGAFIQVSILVCSSSDIADSNHKTETERSLRRSFASMHRNSGNVNAPNQPFEPTTWAASSLALFQDYRGQNLNTSLFPFIYCRGSPATLWLRYFLPVLLFRYVEDILDCLAYIHNCHTDI